MTGNEPGYATELDLTNEEAISEHEAHQLIRWYEESHGDGSIELTRFVPFLITHRPGALKRYRRYLQEIHQPDGIPQVLVALLFLHYYMTTGNERGAFYQVIAGRQWGATKREVLDVIELGFLVSGPFGVNAVAERADDYLKAWDDAAPRTVGTPWPESWKPGGSDERVLDMPAFYEAVGSGVPSYVGVLDRHAPKLLAALRRRYEGACSGQALPAPVVPLIQLHWSTIRAEGSKVAAAARAARELGVTRQQVVEVLGWAFLYADELTIASVMAQMEGVLDAW